MAGTVVATQTVVPRGLPSLLGSVAQGGSAVVKTSLAWTSDASGDVSGTAVELPSGTIVAVEFIPGAGGVAPTAAYDVTMTDSLAVNVFDNGAGTSVGANLSETASTRHLPLIGGGVVTYFRRWTPGGNHNLVVAAAGNAKQGTVNVYVAGGVI